MDKHQSFHTELKVLHDALLDYSDQYPKEAEQLNLREFDDKDPSVSRLLEGVAYIGTQIKEHINQDIPEISQTLLEQVAPDLLKPVVSSVVMRFTPNIHELEKTKTIKKDSFVYSNKEKQIKFTTTESLNINPLEVSGVKFEQAQDFNYLTLKFKVPKSLNFERLDLSSFPIYIHEDYETALQIYDLLTQNIESIQAKHGEAVLATDLKVKTKLQSSTKENINSILHTVKKFFVAPESYLFFDIQGMDKISLPSECESFELFFTLKKQEIKTIHWRDEIFVINAVRAENSFDHYTEPFNFEENGYEYVINLDAQTPDDLDLLAINKITSLDAQGGKVSRYDSIRDLDKPNSLHYQLIKRQTVNKKKQYALRFSQQSKPGDVVSIDAEMSNHYLSRKKLKKGDVNQLSEKIEAIACENVARPTLFVEHNDFSKMRWLLLAYLNLQLKTLLSLDNLRSLLNMLNWTKEKRVNHMIDALVDLNHSSSNQMIGGAVYPVQTVEVLLDDRQFVSLSEAILFSELLYCLYLHYIPVNQVLKFKATFTSVKRVYVWDTQIGRKFNL